MQTLLRLTAAVAIACCVASPALAAPRVVVSLKPLHSLVAAVMEGVGTPTLLLAGATSPHVYSLKPSDSRALLEADIVLWGGPGLETYLQKPIIAVAGRARIVTLADEAGLAMLPTREAGEHADAHGGTDGHDMHFWLDPANAARIVAYSAQVLVAADPANAVRYTANRDTALAALRALNDDLTATLASVRGRPFLTLHDAFQYWEARYQLDGTGALTVNPDRLPGARSLAAMRQSIVDSGIFCVFGEPQFSAALGAALVEGTGARLVTVDTIGVDIDPGVQAYAAMMRGLAQAFRACLAP